ncbi:hypothetical protein RBH20_11995 [Haloarcula sp. H-GB4]|uniref:hypothetical protein n=1 Tax=Haloarcula sp. H-GB4 TaxID=3069755 RepID=UPI0027AE92B1|nr:hypothetical protein [Haloarcula sp. H-GB4]MDQ2073256.1 hypothetical protein [Haloarcula sp. H-GB4]
MYSKQILTCLVVICVSLSGCAIGNPAYNGDVEFIGDIHASNGTFVMKGEIANGGMKNITFKNVTVNLYWENGTRIDSIEMGSLYNSIPVNLTRDKVPKYVIIDSPEFWSTEKVEVDYYTRMDSGNYSNTIVTGRSELPIE